MSLSQELDPGDFVVRRKRKRHLVSGAYNCCLICNDPAVPALSESQTFASSTGQDTTYIGTPCVLLFRDDVDGSSNTQGLRFEVEQDNILGSIPVETIVPLDDGVPVTVDTFLKRPTTRTPRKYKTRFQKPGNSEDRMECLDLRSRRIQRAVATPTSPNPNDYGTRKDRRGKARKPKRNRLAEKLLNAVMMTSGEPNEELLQSGSEERICLPMVAEPRSLARSKPRKWGLVDPRKVTTPFRASVFRTTGQGRTMAGTPMSYERSVFGVDRETDNHDIADWQGLQEPSSPCVVKVRRDTANFCEPQLESGKRIKKPRANTAGKANKKARALSSSQLAPSAGLESDGGRTPLDMVPVLIKSRTRQ
ncbi:hypothetical protein AX14_012375 [Amanita brunnescens Koide BX004]|nr:hypothetical protein AX14_012375 [Amanita brunnescens Koide BX004]